MHSFINHRDKLWIYTNNCNFLHIGKKYKVSFVLRASTETHHSNRNFFMDADTTHSNHGAEKSHAVYNHCAPHLTNCVKDNPFHRHQLWNIQALHCNGSSTNYRVYTCVKSCACIILTYNYIMHKYSSCSRRTRIKTDISMKIVTPTILLLHFIAVLYQSHLQMNAGSLVTASICRI